MASDTERLDFVQEFGRDFTLIRSGSKVASMSSTHPYVGSTGATIREAIDILMAANPLIDERPEVAGDD